MHTCMCVCVKEEVVPQLYLFFWARDIIFKFYRTLDLYVKSLILCVATNSKFLRNGLSLRSPPPPHTHLLLVSVWFVFLWPEVVLY